MIPLRDHHQTAITPWVTYLLIGLNLAVFIYMLSLGSIGLDRFIDNFALIPRDILSSQNLHTLITSMFLHGGLLHLVGNLLFLHVFGDNLEEALGHLNYLAFYLFTGLAAISLQILVNPLSAIPNLGASGAIAGLMGGYLMLFPKNQIDVLIPLGLIFPTIRLPAYSVLFFWIVFQILQGFGSLSSLSTGGIAFFAHIGGFIAGSLFVARFTSQRHLKASA